MPPRMTGVKRPRDAIDTQDPVEDATGQLERQLMAMAQHPARTGKWLDARDAVLESTPPIAMHAQTEYQFQTILAHLMTSISTVSCCDRELGDMRAERACSLLENMFGRGVAPFDSYRRALDMVVVVRSHDRRIEDVLTSWNCHCLAPRGCTEPDKGSVIKALRRATARVAWRRAFLCTSTLCRVTSAFALRVLIVSYMQ
jgi:hypothetical protein